MAEHILRREITLQRPRAEIFDFFSDAGNLEVITPPGLHFRIITPMPIKVGKGTLIEYDLRLRGIPVRWQTEISTWEPPYEFVDTQLRGPYTQWIHRHTFTEIGPDETLMEDEVRYRLPFEPLGEFMHFLVERELKTIFDFRQDTVRRLFANAA